MLVVIERTDGTRLGIASLFDIDAPNRRAEFIIGFPGALPHGTLVLRAGALLADLAFKRLQFQSMFGWPMADTLMCTCGAPLARRGSRTD
jgi:hypothetical protein